MSSNACADTSQVFFIDDPDDPALQTTAARLYRRRPGDGKMSQTDLEAVEQALTASTPTGEPAEDGMMLLPRHLVECADGFGSQLCEESSYANRIESRFYIDAKMVKALQLRTEYLSTLDVRDQRRTYFAYKKTAHDFVKSVTDRLLQRGTVLRGKDVPELSNQEERAIRKGASSAEKHQLTPEEIWGALHGKGGEGKATSYEDSFLHSDFEATTHACEEAEQAVGKAVSAYVEHICGHDFQQMLAEQYVDDENTVFVTSVLLNGLERCDEGRKELQVQMGFDTEGSQGAAFAKAMDNSIGLGKLAFKVAGAGQQIARLVSLGTNELLSDIAVAWHAQQSFRKLRAGKYRTLCNLVLDGKTIGDLIPEKAERLRARFRSGAKDTMRHQMAEYLASADGKYNDTRQSVGVTPQAAVLLVIDAAALVFAVRRYVEDWKKSNTRDKVINGVNLAKDLASSAETILRFAEAQRKVRTYGLLKSGAVKTERAALRVSGAAKIGRLATGLGATAAVITIAVDVYKLVESLVGPGRVEWEDVFLNAIAVLTGVLALVGLFVGVALGATLNLIGLVITAVMYVVERYVTDHRLVNWLETTPWGVDGNGTEPESIDKLIATVDSYYKDTYSDIIIGFDDDDGVLYLQSGALELARFELTVSLGGRSRKISPNPDYGEGSELEQSRAARFLMDGEPNRDLSLLHWGKEVQLRILDPWGNWAGVSEEEVQIGAGINLDADKTPELIGEDALALIKTPHLELADVPRTVRIQPNATGVDFVAKSSMSERFKLVAQLTVDGQEASELSSATVQQNHRERGKALFHTPLRIDFNSSFRARLQQREGPFQATLATELRDDKGRRRNDESYRFSIVPQP